MTKTGRFVPAAAAAALFLVSAPVLLPGPGAQAAPSAIVEDSAPSIAGLGAMDYIDPGRVITLKPGDWLVLGYLSSCIREEIQGGTITVGASESNVAGGKIKRSVIPCGGAAQLSQAQAGKSGAIVLRKAPNKKGAAAQPEPAITVLSLSPVLRPAADGAIKLQRLDQPGEPVVLPVKSHSADLLSLGIQLTPGGLYRATAGQTSTVFRVAPAATEAGGPLLSRLVHF